MGKKKLTTELDHRLKQSASKGLQLRVGEWVRINISELRSVNKVEKRTPNT
jgi:hypothetical protein